MISAVDGSGATPDNLVDVSAAPLTNEGPRVSWDFAYSIPVTKVNDVLIALVRVRTNSAMEMGFAISRTDMSPKLQASKICPYPTLASYARRQAETMPQAAGVSVGPVLALSDATTGRPTMVVPEFSFAADPSVLKIATGGIKVGNSAYWVIGVPPPPTCALKVQYKLRH